MKSKNQKMYDHDPDEEELNQGEKELSDAEHDAADGKDVSKKREAMLYAHNGAYRAAAKARSDAFSKSEEAHAVAEQQAAGDKIVAEDQANKDAAFHEKVKNGGYAADQHINH